MKALILDSGVGERLRPLTERMPKPLLMVGSNTLLGHQLDNLLSCDIRDVIITTGPFENKIKSYMRERYPNINVSYVRNPRYRATNYIYSMWLARELIDDDIILLHGDLLFGKKLLKKLISQKFPNCVLVNKKIKPPKKDFKAVIKGNRVAKIGVEFSGKNAFFSVPLYKFSKPDFLYWLGEIEKFVKRGDLKIYAESVFNEISDTILLHPLYFTEEFCMEIDTKEDLDLARDLLKIKFSEFFLT